MDNSVMGAGLLPGSTAGILDLDPPIQRQQQQQHHLPHPPAAPHHHMHTMSLNGDHHSMGLFDLSNSPSARGISVGAPKGKGVSPSSAAAANNHHHHHNNNTSDDEDDNEDNGAEDHLNGGNRAKKGSPWHRMKWTDEMVRLLITVVACVGDDGAPPEANDGLGKRKHGGGGGAVLQKKGKWKTVSKLMLEKGCCVSPQQCEDKFNDLNKRYKRLNEILGRGTTCRVVENPALLDSMPHVSAKAKEDVRKILSSKHLFYREMCAYHNGQRIPSSLDLDLQDCGPPAVGSSRDEEEQEDDDDEDDEENGDDEERNAEFGMGGWDSFRVEMDGMLQDTTKSAWEQQDWFRKRALQLQEERMEIQAKAFELEKSRFKWQRFCSKKNRELERMRLDNERMSLENERMALQVKQREVELHFKSSGELVDSSGFGIERPQ